MSRTLDERHGFAIELAREAGALASDYRRRLGALEAKQPMADNGLTQGNPILACTPEIAERIATAVSLRDLWTGG